MKAIILAAGRGSRMLDLTANQPKCFLMLKDKRLIDWQLQALTQAGIDEIAIVRGYLKACFQEQVHYFENPFWMETNMVSTLLCADQWLLSDTCIISYADIVYSSEIVCALAAYPGDIVISYDPHWLTLWARRFTDPLSDAECFQYKNDTLLQIGGPAKSLSEIQGQYMGLLKFTPKGWKIIRKILAALSPEHIKKMDMTMLLKLLLTQNQKIQVVPNQQAWCEVDTPTDYQILQEMMADP